MKAKRASQQSSFEIEKAIKEWKKGLLRTPSFQDGDIVELEGYLRDKIDELIEQGAEEEAAFRKAASAFTDLKDLEGDYFRARSTSRIKGRPPWRPPRFMPALLWNYFKVTARKIKRQKAYSFITIAGLTVGMAAFLLITLYCRFERSYDSFHRNSGRIFRIQNDRISAARHDRSAACPPGLGPALAQEFPEILEYTRLMNVSGESNIVSREIEMEEGANSGVAGQIISFYERRVFYADPSFFKIFSFPLVRGDEETALNEPDAAVLSESAVRKYFGDEDPIGRTISVKTRFRQMDYRITGVCRDLPQNTHLQFDLLLSFSSLTVVWPSLENQIWGSNAFLTYILLNPSADPQSLEAKFPSLMEAYPLESADFRREFHLQPLRSIHLTSHLRWEAGINGELRTIVFLEIISIFILVIAWVNSINLATARSLQRGKEVCIRKTLGAGRRQLARQFLFESVFFNLLAFLLALAVISTALPSFSRLVGKSLSPKDLGTGWIWIGLSILVGALLSGAYPSFVLSSFQPVSALRGQSKGSSRGAVLRKALVVFQFALAVLLIASTLIVGKQLSYIQNQDLGAAIDRTLVLRIPPESDSGKRILLARDQLAGLAPITAAAVSTSVPGRGYSNSISGIRRQSASQEEAQAFFIIDTDERYFEFFEIPVLAGRTFSKGFLSDQASVILNEEGVKILGFESVDEAINQNIIIFGDTYRIIGVTKNYNHQSLREKIEPIIFCPVPYSLFPGTDYLSLKIRGDSAQTAIEATRIEWKELFPEHPFEYSFLDNDFSSQYDGDKRFGRIFGLSSLMAVFISCLGLFGLASFSAEQRTREIGIRKVFGASIPDMTAMLTGQFIRWVALANIFAWPLTWLIMERWLGRFAYRTSVDIWTLGISALLALFIAAATVAYKAIKSASANPVDSIRYE